ncbi:MAG: sulfotransferase [Deltaproteobacteria bacterium]|nr:sulfotransferase [Deltaproteobacteria bacterium]
MSKNIIILGFGRSGTTWISDIVSKITGKLVLFEPVHPSVTEHVERFAYATITDRETSSLLKDFYNKVLNKQHRKMWLLRNHVPDRLEHINPDFLTMLWEECGIIGFKEIRANFMMEWYLENLPGKIVFVIRHPCATVASIKKRVNFWEFGWPYTYDLFLGKTLFNEHYQNHPIQNCVEVVRRADSDIAKYAVMWAITHAIALPELERLGLPLFFYENFYDHPFSSSREMFNYLGYENVDIHPSFLFTPSMTALATVHGLEVPEQVYKQKGVSFFWDSILNEEEVDGVLDIVKSFGINLYDKHGIMQPSGYSVQAISPFHWLPRMMET